MARGKSDETRGTKAIIAFSAFPSNWFFDVNADLDSVLCCSFLQSINPTSQFEF